MPLNRTYELLQEQLTQARRTGKVNIKVCYNPYQADVYISETIP
jgi:hypothetical protein